MSATLLFDALAARAADSPALRGDHGAWSAGALLAAVEALAAQLHGVGVVAILADNGPEWVLTDLAALRAGVPALPLPPFFSPPQLAHALTQSGADLVVTDQPQHILSMDLGFSAVGMHAGLSWLRRAAPGVRLPRGTAKISYTSGSTGAPKGVCLSADGLLDTARAVQMRLADLPIARHLAVLPLALLLENSAGVLAPLLRGAEVVLPSLSRLGWQGMAGFDPRALHAQVAAHGANSVILVPELLKAWNLLLARAALRVPESLVYAAVGGARVEAGLLAEARQRGLPAYQGYGLTECGSVVSLNRPGDDGEGVGKPLEHARVTVQDGELLVETRAFLGYLGDAPATGAAYATGDLGCIDAAGHVHLAGRRKHLLITSFGRNVSPEWVEAALLAQPQIAQAVVFGDARPFLSAVLVAAPDVDGAALDAAVARANAALPDYARVGGVVRAQPMTPQNGQLTGNGRPVRAAVFECHGAALAALYPSSSTQPESSHVLL